jgi:hypothetical protein
MNHSRQHASLCEGTDIQGRRTFAELLIDCEEDRVLRAVLVWMLREAGGREQPRHTTVSRDTGLPMYVKDRSLGIKVMPSTTPLATAARKTPWRCAVTVMPPVRS